MNYCHSIFPDNTKNPAKHHPLLAVDVETEQDTGDFICAGIHGKRYEFVGRNKIKKERAVSLYFDNQQDFISYIDNIQTFEKSKKVGNACILTFFNADYDLIYLEDITDTSSILRSGGRLITGRMKNNLPILDITNIVPYTSLESWIEALNMEKKFGVYKPDLTDLKLRVTMDAKATYILGNYLEDFFTKECDIPMKLTIGSTGLAFFRRHYLEQPFIRKEQWLNDLERLGYRGGRVEVFKRGEQHVYSYDVNSMYLSIMRFKQIPNPSAYKYITNTKMMRENVLNEAPMYLLNCKIRVPKQYAAPLPYKHNNKLLFPTGNLEGWWYSPELNYAVKNGYIEILEYKKMIIYPESVDYFSNFAKFIWDKRKEYKKSGNFPMDNMIKRVGNSFYGKFAQKVGESNMVKLDDYKGDITGLYTFSRTGTEYIYVPNKAKEASFSFPVISAMITSYARLMILKALKANEDSVVYCDTDSIHVLKPVTRIVTGKELGEWGFEYEKTQTYYRPKMYGNKRKGVGKKNTKKIEDTDEYEKWLHLRPTRSKSSIRQGIAQNIWMEFPKKLSKMDDKREWIGNESEPIHII